jgi:hypothetical protein
LQEQCVREGEGRLGPQRPGQEQPESGETPRVPSRSARREQADVDRPRRGPAQRPGRDRQQQDDLDHLEGSDGAQLRDDQLATPKRRATEAV